MHALCSTGVARIATLVLGLGLGAVSALSAFRNGNTLGADEIDKIVFGSGFVFVVALTWVLPTLADERIARRKYISAGFLLAVWAMCLVFAAWNAIGFTAMHRGNAVSGRETGMERYALASAEIKRLDAEIETAKAQKVFARTGGCTDVTADLSKQFCAALAEKETARGQAKRVVDAGKPGSADPQSETVAWVTGYDPVDLGRAFPVAFGILVELGAIAAFYAALGGERTIPAPEPREVIDITPEPSVEVLEAVQPKPARLTKQKQALALPAPGILLRKNGQIDGRCSFARAARKITA